MSVQILCPNCAGIAEWHQPPVTDCTACHTPYPEAMRSSAESSLRRTLAPKPMLLVLGQIGSALGGALFASSLATAPFNVGTYSINGEPVSGPEFLRQAGFSFALVGALSLAIAFGLWRERTWVRPLMLLYWLSFPLSVLTTGAWDWASLMGALVMAGIAAGIAGWYLYARPNVRAYFDARS